MNDKQSDLQDSFLNQLKTDKTPVTAILTNGFQYKGTIDDFDRFTVVLDSDKKQHLIYKHAVSAFVPSKSGTVV
jgi:host factor-I protein